MISKENLQENNQKEREKKMIFIKIVVIILWLVLIAWSWHNLGSIDKIKKIKYSFIGILGIFLITFLFYQFSQNGIAYENKEIKNAIRNLLVAIFTAINGYLVLPFVFKMLDYKEEKKMTKEQIQKRLGILLIILVIFAILEVSYLQNTQQGILAMIQQLKA